MSNGEKHGRGSDIEGAREFDRQHKSCPRRTIAAEKDASLNATFLSFRNSPSKKAAADGSPCLNSTRPFVFTDGTHRKAVLRAVNTNESPREIALASGKPALVALDRELVAGGSYKLVIGDQDMEFTVCHGAGNRAPTTLEQVIWF